MAATGTGLTRGAIGLREVLLPVLGEWAGAAARPHRRIPASGRL